MKNFDSMTCPVCDTKLQISRLSCPQCKAEYPIDKEIFPFEYLSTEQKSFLITFLKCSGNIKAIETELDISYPTVKKTLDEIIDALGFGKINITESKKMTKEEVYRALKNGDITFEQAEEYLKEDADE